MEQITTPTPESDSSEPQSVWTRMANVFAAPGIAFEGIHSLERKTMLWLVPMIVTIVLGGGFLAVVMHNPAIKAEMRFKQVEQMQKFVDKGRMTADDMEKGLDRNDRWTTTFGPAAFIVVVPAMLLLVSLLYMLMVQFLFGGRIGFDSAFAVASLSWLVFNLETVVSSLLSITLGKMTTTSAAALLPPNSAPILESVLSHVNPFTFWWMWVLAIGLAANCEVPRTKLLAGIVGIFVLYVASAAALGQLFTSAFGG